MFLPQIKNKKRFYKEITKFVKHKLEYVGVDKTLYNDIKKLKQNNRCRFYDAPFFKKYIAKPNTEILGVKLTPLAYSMLGELGGFMSFDMNEFCSFESKYTKLFLDYSNNMKIRKSYKQR